MRIIICLLALFVNTALASSLFDKKEIDPAMKVKGHLEFADAVIIGRFTGNSHRYLFDGYDEDGHAKTKLFTPGYNMTKEGFSVAMREWEIAVDEVLFSKEDVKVDSHITLIGGANFEPEDSPSNQKQRKMREDHQFMMFLRLSNEARREDIENHFGILTTQSLIKLGDETKALYYREEWPIHAAEETDGKKGKNGIQRMKTKINKPKAFIDHTKALISKQKK